jgi:hypothetical protein
MLVGFIHCIAEKTLEAETCPLNLHLLSCVITYEGIRPKGSLEGAIASMTKRLERSVDVLIGVVWVIPRSRVTVFLLFCRYFW